MTDTRELVQTPFSLNKWPVIWSLSKSDNGEDWKNGEAMKRERFEAGITEKKAQDLNDGRP